MQTFTLPAVCTGFARNIVEGGVFLSCQGLKGVAQGSNSGHLAEVELDLLISIAVNCGLLWNAVVLGSGNGLFLLFVCLFVCSLFFVRR